QARLLRIGQGALDPAGRPEREHAGRDLGAGRDEAARANQRLRPDLRAVQEDGPDANERVVVDGAAVQHGAVADGDVVADGGVERVRLDVDDRQVLDVGVL